MTNEYIQIAKLYDEVRRFAAQHQVTIWMAAQTSNPAREPKDVILPSDRALVLIDYIKLGPYL